jgi:hypothetical protein
MGTASALGGTERAKNRTRLQVETIASRRVDRRWRSDTDILLNEFGAR